MIVGTSSIRDQFEFREIPPAKGHLPSLVELGRREYSLAPMNLGSLPLGKRVIENRSVCWGGDFIQYFLQHQSF